MTLAIAEFGRPSVALLQRRLDETLAELGKELGITIEVDGRSVRYNKTLVTFKAEARISTPEGQKGREQVEFEQSCGLFGLTPADYQMPFAWNGKSWLLTGFNLQAVKYPFSATNQATGKSYKLPPSALPEAAAKSGFGPRVPLFASVPPPPVPPVGSYANGAPIPPGRPGHDPEEWASAGGFSHRSFRGV